ncbi:MAG TPA: sulfotransferase domain-containing protein [Vitreimonas sp.]|nr:sulfotransferase domain-containing protein [Vitreimonas sp.]
MLIYQATYPRCGAAFLRDLISINFGYLSGNGYDSDHTFPEKWDVTPLEGEPDLQTYKRPGSEERQLLLRHGALKALTPELRQRLAADPRLLFVKTHELPPERAFPGEVALQFVRHPGPTIVSYWRLMNVKKPVDLDDVIEGRAMFGSWTAYHDAWERAPMPLMRLRYEDVLADQDAAIHAIAGFLALPAPARIRHMPMSAATSRNPSRNPGEGLDGWRRRTTGAQRQEIWRRHGSLAYRYGYTPFPGASSVKRNARFTSAMR